MSIVRIINVEPQDMIDDLEAELKGALANDPFSSMMVLPSPAACKQVTDRLIADGIVLLGRPICTLDELVKHLFLEGAVKEAQIDRQQAELIIRGIMEERRSELSHFEPMWTGLAPTITELRALFDTWREFRVDIDLIGTTGPAAQAAMVFTRYLERMGNDHLSDQVGAKETVVRWLGEGRSTVPKKVWMLGLNELSPLDRELVKAIAGSAEGTVFVVRQDGGRAFNENLSWLGAETKVEGRPAPAEMLDTLKGKVVLRARSFSDPLEEARAVASNVRSLVDSGTLPGSICVLLPMRESSAELYRETLDDCGVWCNMEVPTDLLRSPVVHTMLELFETVVEDMPREHVVRLLSSPYLKFRYSAGGERKTLYGGTVGRLADEAGVIGGPVEWEEKLGCLRRDLELMAASSEISEEKAVAMRGKADRAASVSTGLKELFDCLGTIDGRMTVERRIHAIKGALHRLEADRHLYHEDGRVHRREARALASFFRVLDDLVDMERTTQGKEDLRSFAGKVRLLCSNKKEELEPRYEGAVLVAGLRAAAMTRHDHVFIVGMVEGDLPYLGAGNPFITDEDVARFHLLDKRDMLRQERVYFYSAILSARKGVVLSCHASNDGEKVVSSSFYDDVVGPLRPEGFGSTDAHASRALEQKALGKAIAGKGTWDGVLHASPVDAGETLRRINVETFHRVEEYDSPFDGMLSNKEILADLNELVGPAHSFSPTELDMYASCPQRYYLNRILRIDPRPELEAEISGKDQGTFVHQVAFRLFSEMRERKAGRVTFENLDEVERRARVIAEDELSKLRFSGPSYEAFRARMAGSKHRKGLLRAFLEFEAANTTPFDPRYFELAFGRKLPENCDPTSIEEPVAIMLTPTERLLLAGRVDRVDVRKDGRFMVIDYKTGELPKMKDVTDAKSLQVQLYLQGIQSMISGSKGIGGIFYRVKSESEIEYATLVLDRTEEADLKPIIGRKRLLESTDELIADTNLKISGMLRGMRNGSFHPALDEKDCKSYCEYKHVCRFDAQRALDMGGE